MRCVGWFSTLLLLCGIIGINPSASVAGNKVCTVAQYTHSVGDLARSYQGNGECWDEYHPGQKWPVTVNAHFHKGAHVLSADIQSGAMGYPHALSNYHIAVYCKPIRKDCFLYDVPYTSLNNNTGDPPDYYADLPNFLRIFFPSAAQDAWRQENDQAIEEAKLLNTQHWPLIFSPKTDSVQSEVNVVTRLLWPAAEADEGWKFTVVFDKWDSDQGSTGKWVSGPFSYTEYDAIQEEYDGNNLSKIHFYIRGQKKFNIYPGKYRVTVRAVAKDGRQTPWSPKIEFSVEAQLAQSPECNAKKTKESIIMSKPLPKADTFDKAHAPPKITMPAQGQVVNEGYNGNMVPFHYGVSFTAPVDLSVRFKLWGETPGGGSGWSSPLLQKDISAEQMSAAGSTGGVYTFSELLYMPPGRYQIDAKGKLTSSKYTMWGKGVTFHLGTTDFVPQPGVSSLEIKPVGKGQGDSLSGAPVEAVEILMPLIQGAKPSYRPGDRVVFIMPDALKSKPFAECLNGRQWSKKCPKGLTLHKMSRGG